MTTTTQIDFWVENEKLYVTLAHIAQDILIMPASSTRFFSKVEYASSGRMKYFLRRTNNTFSQIIYVLNLTITN